MSVFEIPKDSLLQLSDTKLEHLVAKLARAEIASQGISPSYVYWSGSINAKDGGIDIQVEVPEKVFDTGFLKRPNTVFQAKKDTMPASKVTSEMSPNGTLAEIVAHQASIGGSYIIACLRDDCSPPMRRDRLKAMRKAVAGHPNEEAIHLDFYDRSRLHQWLIQHPSVILWFRSEIGQPLSGWEPYGAWSKPPADANDSFVRATGIAITLPDRPHEKLTIEQSIDSIRDLIRSTTKSIRFTGLSGVGKTRIVQALFEDSVGAIPLDHTKAVYVDVGAGPQPSAAAMLDMLIQREFSSYLILDNCPSSVHSGLASKLSSTKSDVRLLSIEYDIREDKPQTTEVIRIEADGPRTAEVLLNRRFPEIGQDNARRIAIFANGNARISLAIAERVNSGDSLAHLSDSDLFDRLFDQRNALDSQLRADAETLSLVYSFSVEVNEDGVDEMSLLRPLSNNSRLGLFRSTAKLIDRQIAQARGPWRAILPQAIANRLAAGALTSIPSGVLRRTFEQGDPRLLRSFAHRLSFMHDHPVAQEIVQAWFQPSGLIGANTTLDRHKLWILEHAAPVAPTASIQFLQTHINSEDFSGHEASYSSNRTRLHRLITSLAYDAIHFEGCFKILVRIASFEDERDENRHGSARKIVQRFFQPFASGTHATKEQKRRALSDTLYSDDTKLKRLGVLMLKAALSTSSWLGTGMPEFGARPRDFGHEPKPDELSTWRIDFLKIAVTAASPENGLLAVSVRSVLANCLRGLWASIDVQPSLIQLAKTLHEQEPWIEGWKAIRKIIYYEYIKNEDHHNNDNVPAALTSLEEFLEPQSLMSRIETYVTGDQQGSWIFDDDFAPTSNSRYQDSEKRLNQKARELGKEFSDAGYSIALLGESLFSTKPSRRRFAFGMALAEAAVGHSRKMVGTCSGTCQ